jgi:hypothetical protein
MKTVRNKTGEVRAMVKGNIEWEFSRENGFTLRISPPPGCPSRSELRRYAAFAGKETLLALRSLIDVITQNVEEKESGTNQTGTRIKVE